MTMSNAQRARISASAAGASGKAEKAKAAALAAAETGSPSPAQAFRLDCEAVRVQQARSSRAAASTIRPGSRLGGRPARSRHSDKRFAAGPSGVPDGEAQVAQRAFVGVEAQDLGGGGGALKRQAGAQRAGGGRVAAQGSVEKREAGAGGEQRIALPALPLARAQAGIGAGGGKACRSGAFAVVSACSRALRRSGAGTPSPRVWSGSASEVEVGANHCGMVNLARRFVTFIWRVIRPACRGWGCPIMLPYRTQLKARPKPMPNAAKSGPEPLQGAQRTLRRRPSAPPRRRKRRARARAGGPPARSPVWRGPAVGRTPSPWAIGPRGGALPPIPGTAPRRRPRRVGVRLSGGALLCPALSRPRRFSG